MRWTRTGAFWSIGRCKSGGKRGRGEVVAELRFVDVEARMGRMRGHDSFQLLKDMRSRSRGCRK